MISALLQSEHYLVGMVNFSCQMQHQHENVVTNMLTFINRFYWLVRQTSYFNQMIDNRLNTLKIHLYHFFRRFLSINVEVGVF